MGAYVSYNFHYININVMVYILILIVVKTCYKIKLIFTYIINSHILNMFYLYKNKISNSHICVKCLNKIQINKLLKKLA